MIYKYKTTRIYPGKGWRDDEGVQYPRNWNIWSADEKAERGVIEIKEDPVPDGRLYDWEMDDNGKVTSTPKSMSFLKADVKKQIDSDQLTRLNESDWAIIRKADKGTAVPTNIQTWRDAIRAKAVEMENAINACSNIDEVANLWVVHNDDGSVKSGILYVWPELEE